MKTLENLFLPYDLAVQMKEKGFNEACLVFFQEGHIWRCNDTDPDESLFLNSGWIKDYINAAGAPTWQQATDWLREEHGIDLKFEPTIKAQYDGFIQQYMGWKYIGTFSTHREALTEAIREALKLIP